ncbi:MAG: aminotransferase class V-fold PLP-dependent enzyme [Coriobacteriales bacterium]|jgi:cysteine desulfurase/selenocysteine lyase
MSVDIVNNPYKQDFPLLATHPELAFLDSAATAQRPASVLDAERRFYETMNANPLRGLYELSIEATEAIENTRKHIARFIGAGEENFHDIIFSRNTSEALNMLAYSFGDMVLKEGDEVCITIMEHHSNLIPWQQVCKRTGAKLVYLYCEKDGTITEEEMQAKIGPKTKIVSAGHVSNVLGVINPIKRLGELVHAQGGYLIVDGAQSVPHMPVDVKDLGCDFFAFSGHKVFGPMGIGVLWGKHELLDAMPPFLTGGEMIEEVSEQDAVWSPVPEKFEAGTQDAAGIYATDAALTYVEEKGFAPLEEREAALMEYLAEQMESLDFIEVVGPEDPAKRRGAFSFNVKGVHPHDVSGILAGENVAIRAGHHCAQPLLLYLGMHTCCRASVAFYNDKADIDALIEGLKLVGSMFNVK